MQAFRDYNRTKDWSGNHHIMQSPARFEYLTSDAYTQLRLTFKQDYAHIFVAFVSLCGAANSFASSENFWI